MKRLVAKLLVAATLVGTLSGCGSNENHDVVSISIYNTKPEIQTVLEEASEVFEDSHPNINVKILRYSRYQEVKEKLASRRSTHNMPTIMIVDSLHIQEIKDEFLNLENESWMEQLGVEMGKTARNSQGELIAFPFAVEGMGLIYNKKVMDECGIDPSTIHTRSALEDAFKKVESSGRKGVVITNDDWSLANHFFTTAYAVKSSDNEQKVAFIEDLKAGKVDLTQDQTINGLLDTFDIMKNYNLYKEAPLSNSNERSAGALGSGEVGFWYMGNWALQDILKNDTNKGEYGFIPVPISDNAQDYGNNEITAAIKYLVIDKTFASEEQQAAAKEFLNWLVYDEAGNNFMINEAELILGAVGNEVVYNNCLSNSIQEYQENGQVIEQMMAYLPQETIVEVGDLLRAYLDNQIDRATFLNELKAFWIRRG